MNVVAKFRCESVTKLIGGNEVVKFTAIDKDANTQWSKYTPSGSIDMCITQEGAQDFFQPGKNYSLSFADE